MSRAHKFVLIIVSLATPFAMANSGARCFELMRGLPGSRVQTQAKATPMFDFDIPKTQVSEGKAKVDRKFLEETLFVVPQNDGEAVRAVQILQALEAPNLRVSTQPWGATLDREGLSAKLPAHIKRLVVFEMPSVEVEANYTAQGVEVVVLDHHFYSSLKLDRSNPVSSIEQLAKLLNWPMSRIDMALAVNDRGYIPGLKALGLTDAEIREIRSFDLIAQGRSAKEVADLTAISQRELGTLRVEAGVTIIDRPVADEGILKQELAIRTSDGIAHTLLVNEGRVSFSGDPKVVKALLDFDFERHGYVANTFAKYGGGDPNASMYFGFNPKQPPTGAGKLVPDKIQRLMRETVRQARLEGGHQ